jgi:signal transduction histidine kinase
VSHEFRTPLTSIRSFSEIVRDNPDLEVGQRREFLEIIVQESERLTRLINDILDLAKMEAGQADWQVAEFAPKAVIEHALAATAGLFSKARHITLETHIADNLPPVHADADRLTQVVVNLISNAVKFCDKDHGLVRLEAQREDAFLRVSVRDNGIGIAEQDQDKIFERFQQAGDTLTDKPQGTGLGLPICRQILKRFGGDIWVKSERGKGATFSFRVPLAGSSEHDRTLALEKAG